MNQNSERFLDSFNTIEKFLRRFTGSDSQVSFYQLIELASRSDAAVRNLRVDLQEYADLRNAIVHERTNGHVIAEPNQRAVEKIGQMLLLITKPPVIREFMTSPVTDFNVSDSIGTAVKDMYSNGYSQAPIYKGNEFIGLLTTNTIARWLGASAIEEIFSLTETSIGEVLKHSENPHNFTFKNPDTSVYEVLDFIKKQEMQGNHIDAILVTHSGKKTESLLGILTTWDMPKLYRAIQIL